MAGAEPPELLAMFQTKFRGVHNNIQLLQQTIEEMIADYDTNGDDKLQWTEFVDMVHYGNFWERSVSYAFCIVTLNSSLSLSSLRLFMYDHLNCVSSLAAECRSSVVLYCEV